MIIFMSGMYDGMREHAKQVSIDTEISGGAYWHPQYDPIGPHVLLRMLTQFLQVQYRH